MFLADSHVHTAFSHDAHFTMREMGVALAANGMTHACFTDHIDITVCRRFGFWHDPEAYTGRDSVERVFHRVADEFSDRCKLHLGIEISGLLEDSRQASRITSDPALDFVIGSIHNLTGINDFYYLDYRWPVNNRILAERYLEEYRQIARSRRCDVLGHIGYITRYMVRQGATLDFMQFEEQLRLLFRETIDAGLGIEVNTSGLRGATDCTFPTLPMLRLYRECGGELITVGSDAHRPADAGYGIADTYQMLSELGFRYVAFYERRQPVMYPIG